MTSALCRALALAPLVIASLTVAAPPRADHAGEYAAQLLDADNPQRYQAASRLKAVNERERVPVEVEHRLADFLRESATVDSRSAELIGDVAAVLGTSHPESPAIADIIGALTVVLERQRLPAARRAAADALAAIARHTGLPAATARVLEDRGFDDPDRKVRIAAMRGAIQAGPDESVKRRIHRVLVEQAGLSEAEFAAPDDWNYDIRNDQNALLSLLWSLHQPEVPEDVVALWVTKLLNEHSHETAYHLLEKVVKLGPLPPRIYDQLQGVAESGSRVIDSGRRERLYRLLQQSRHARAPDAADAIDDIAMARTLAFQPDMGKRRTAAHRLREFANANPLHDESLVMIAGVARNEPDRELQVLALRIIGYAAPREYVDVMHDYFNTGRFDQLALRVFLAAYGREAWIRAYAGDVQLHARFRAAAIYDYTHSGFEAPDEVIDLLQDIARHDPEYAVRQAAGQGLRHLGAWVPLQTRLERQENQLQALLLLWESAIGVCLLSALLGMFFIIVRFSRVRRKVSALGILGWAAVAVLLVPAIGFGALSLFRHNGPTPTSGEMLLTFLPTYVLAAYFAYGTLRIARSGLGPAVGRVPG